MFQSIRHFFKGCIPGEILYRDATAEFQKGKREIIRVKEFTVHKCLKCGEPFIHKFWTQVEEQIERRKRKRQKPDSIPVAA